MQQEAGLRCLCAVAALQELGVQLRGEPVAEGGVPWSSGRDLLVLGQRYATKKCGCL